MKLRRPLLSFFGHHKAGTQWLLGLISEVCLNAGLCHSHFHSPKMFKFDIGEAVKEQSLDFVSYTNADISFARPIIRNTRGFHVVRDPRDMVVSAYFSHLYSHSDKFWPELKDYRRLLENVEKDEGLLLTMEHMTRLLYDGVEVDVFGGMSSWDYSLPNVMEVKFEELILNPFGVFLRILRFLDILDESNTGLKAVPSYLLNRLLSRLARATSLCSKARPVRFKVHPCIALGIVYKYDFERLSGGRKPGEESEKHHYRKGISGDWKNHFNDEHKGFFKSHYESLLIKLGYETNSEW